MGDFIAGFLIGVVFGLLTEALCVAAGCDYE